MPTAHRRTRTAFADHLTHVGPITCWRCHQPIRPGEPWDLGHQTDRALGGTDTPDNLWPEHRHCNRSAGRRLGQFLARHGARNRTTPSRNW